MSGCRTCKAVGWIWVANLTDPDNSERDICPDCGGKGI